MATSGLMQVRGPEGFTAGKGPWKRPGLPLLLRVPDQRCQKSYQRDRTVPATVTGCVASHRASSSENVEGTRPCPTVTGERPGYSK